MRGTDVVTGGLLGRLLVEAFEGNSVPSLCSLFVMVSCRFQYIWSGGGKRNGIANIKQAANVGTAPAT